MNKLLHDPISRRRRLLTTAAPSSSSSSLYSSSKVELVKNVFFFQQKTRPEGRVEVAGNEDNSEKGDGMMKGGKEAGDERTDISTTVV